MRSRRGLLLFSRELAGKVYPPETLVSLVASAWQAGQLRGQKEMALKPANGTRCSPHAASQRN